MSKSTKSVSPEVEALLVAAADANATLITSAVALEQAFETFEADFIASAQRFAAARDGGATVAMLAGAVKQKAGKSSVALRGVQWFTSNAAVEAHAHTGRLFNLPGSLADDVTAETVQTVITQVYNHKGGAALIREAFKGEDRESVFANLQAALATLKAADKAQASEGSEESEGTETTSETSIEDLLTAAAGPILKAAERAESEGVTAETLAIVAVLWKALATIDAVADRKQMADEAADLADLAS